MFRLGAHLKSASHFFNNYATLGSRTIFQQSSNHRLNARLVLLQSNGDLFNRQRLFSDVDNGFHNCAQIQVTHFRRSDCLLTQDNLFRDNLFSHDGFWNRFRLLLLFFLLFHHY